jgi:apolipoprotein N-acyltransferase
MSLPVVVSLPARASEAETKKMKTFSSSSYLSEAKGYWAGSGGLGLWWVSPRAAVGLGVHPGKTLTSVFFCFIFCGFKFTLNYILFCRFLNCLSSDKIYQRCCLNYDLDLQDY